jgi:hypothetical protein
MIDQVLKRNYTGGDTNSNPSTPGAQDRFSNKSGGRAGYFFGGRVNYKVVVEQMLNHNTVQTLQDLMILHKTNLVENKVMVVSNNTGLP